MSNETQQTHGATFDENAIVRAIDSLCVEVHRTAVSKGWWDGGDRNLGELVALCHAELSELLEGARHGNPPSDHIPEFTSEEEEAADTIIRLSDMGCKRGWRLGQAIVAKMRFNANRPHRHGGKAF